ncbi:MAG: substrate-binding domain-containing protein [Anaerorhabdus sp.]
MLKKFLCVLALALLVSGCSSNSSGKDTAQTPSPIENEVLRISTTTSVNDSGLLEMLQPLFEEETGYKLEITSNGTGQAIKLAEGGNADLILVHAKASEEEFINNGFGKERIPFMYNFFVIVGPKEDSAAVKDAATAKDAFSQIANTKALFASRGDDSGTNKAEMKIWKSIEIDPVGEDWYVATGKGMGDTLNIANEQQAYVMTDKATFLSYQQDLDLEILKEEDESLKNTYSLIAVSESVADDINTEGAQAFIDWMTSENTLKLISEFGVEEYGENLFYSN